jgi:hypothetical protein
MSGSGGGGGGGGGGDRRMRSAAGPVEKQAEPNSCEAAAGLRSFGEGEGRRWEQKKVYLRLGDVR